MKGKYAVKVKEYKIRRKGGRKVKGKSGKEIEMKGYYELRQGRERGKYGRKL